MHAVSNTDDSTTICPVTSKMVILVWGIAAQGGGMRTDVCFSSTNYLLGKPPPHNVKFRDLTAESIPLKDVHTMCRTGCIYFNLLCHLSLNTGLHFYVFCDMSISSSSWDDWIQWGVVSLVLQVLLVSWIGRGKTMNCHCYVEGEHCLYGWIFWGSEGRRQQPGHMWPSLEQAVVEIPLPYPWEWQVLFHINLLNCCLFKVDWTVQWARCMGIRTTVTLDWIQRDGVTCTMGVCVPNFWHLKHRTVFGKYGLTLYLLYNTVTHSGMVGDSKVKNIVPVGTNLPSSFFWTWYALDTYWFASVACISLSLHSALVSTSDASHSLEVFFTYPVIRSRAFWMLNGLKSFRVLGQYALLQGIAVYNI
jgi:hypothetical protein